MAFAVVQNTNNGVGSVGVAVTATYTSIPTSGNLLLASIGNSTNATALTSVVDSAGNTWTLLSTNNSTIAAQANYWYFRIAGTYVSAPTVTATLATAKLYMNIYELSGNFAATNGTASTLIDNSQTAIGGNTVTGTTTSGTQGSVTTTNTADLVISNAVGTAALSNTTSATAPSGSTTPGLEQVNGFLIDSFWIETGTGTYNPYFTWVNNRRASQLTIALLPAAATVSTTHNLTLLGVGS